MKTILGAAAIVLAGLGNAIAMPASPLALTENPTITRVAQGCGPGWARGPMGRCRPMGYRAGPVYRAAPVVVVPRVMMRPARICPPGFVFRGGRCRGF